MKIIEKIKKLNNIKYEQVELYEEKIKNGEILTPKEKKIYKNHKREIRHLNGYKKNGKTMVVMLFSIELNLFLDTIGWYNLLAYIIGLIIVNIIGVYIYIYTSKNRYKFKNKWIKEWLTRYYVFLCIYTMFTVTLINQGIVAVSTIVIFSIIVLLIALKVNKFVNGNDENTK